MDTDRRTLLRLLAATPAAGAFTWSTADVAHASEAQAAAQRAGNAAGPFKPAFFTAHEYETVRVLVDMIIPKDERSGSATDAGVPEFMDFFMTDGDREQRRTAMRGGLAWLDRESVSRYGKNFVGASEGERAKLLDAIAWPQKADPGLSHGVGFFNSFRDLTASGFWTSKMGIADLQYMGNVYVPEWTGCPPEALKKLGLDA
jgi:Gluconate 2-dehydrogenase subunit 3